MAVLWMFIELYSRVTVSTAAHFVDKLEQRMPFTVRAIQVDRGSEFEAVFEEECQRRNIKLFVLPPRSPKLNGGVKQAHRTHTVGRKPTKGGGDVSLII